MCQYVRKKKEPFLGFRIDIVVQHVKPPSLMLATHMNVHSSLTCPTFDSDPANTTDKLEDGPSTYAAVTHLGNGNEAPGSAPATVAISGTESLSPSLSI